MNLFTEIKAKLSIVEVISEYATLTKAGAYYKAPCPFHAERTASFTVTPQREIFYCFGCHAGGDVIAFVARAEHCSQWEAAHILRERYELPLPAATAGAERYTQRFEEHQRHTRLCSLVAQWCTEQLAHQSGARAYLTQRAITEVGIARFSLGVFPGGAPLRKQFLHFLSQQGFLLKDLLVVKIMLQGAHGPYSPFEDRIIFPISDPLGRICGFGGRTYLPGDARPKYYNSHDHPYFSKGSLLFGLEQAKKSIQQLGSVYLTEGYTDSILLAQAGVRNTVATLGTACTEEHIKLLSRYAQRVMVTYDADRAGIEATMKLGALCWQHNLDLLVTQLPESHDPASFIAQGGTISDCAQLDVFSFCLSTTTAQLREAPLAHKLDTIRTILKLLITIQDPLKQAILLEQAAKTWSLPVTTLQQELARLTAHKPPLKAETPTQSTQLASIATTQKGITPFARGLFCAILNSTVPLPSEELLMACMIIPEPYVSLLRAWDGELRAGNRDFSTFFSERTTAEQSTLSHLLHQQERIPATAAHQQEAENFTHIRTALRKRYWRIMLQTMRTELQEAHAAQDATRVADIVHKFQKLKHAIQDQGIV